MDITRMYICLYINICIYTLYIYICIHVYSMQRQTNTKVWIGNDELHWKAECFGQNGGMRYRPQGKMDPGLVLQIPRGKTNLVLKSWYPGIKLEFVMWYIQWVGAARICCFVLYGVNGKISFTHVEHVGCDLSESQRRFASCRCASAVYVVGFIGFRLSALSKKPPPWPQWWPLDPTVKELLNRQKIFFHGEKFLKTKKKTRRWPQRVLDWSPGRFSRLETVSACRCKLVAGQTLCTGGFGWLERSQWRGSKKFWQRNWTFKQWKKALLFRMYIYIWDYTTQLCGNYNQPSGRPY